MKSSRMGYSVPLGHSADRSVYDTNKQTNKPQAPPAGVPRGLRSLSRYRRDRVWSSRWDQMAGIQMSDKPYLINYGQSILLDERFGNNIPKHYTLIEINECGHRFLDLWALRMDTESWPPRLCCVCLCDSSAGEAENPEQPHRALPYSPSLLETLWTCSQRASALPAGATVFYRSSCHVHVLVQEHYPREETHLPPNPSSNFYWASMMVGVVEGVVTLD